VPHVAVLNVETSKLVVIVQKLRAVVGVPLPDNAFLQQETVVLNFAPDITVMDVFVVLGQDIHTVTLPRPVLKV